MPALIIGASSRTRARKASVARSAKLARKRFGTALLPLGHLVQVTRWRRAIWSVIGRVGGPVHALLGCWHGVGPRCCRQKCSFVAEENPRLSPSGNPPRRGTASLFVPPIPYRVPSLPALTIPACSASD